MPASLRASFERNEISYQVDRGPTSSPAQRWRTSSGEETSTGRKAKFGDTYLSRLGVGGRGAYTPAGTDFSQTKQTEEWEEVRLKKQLSEIESKIERVEAAAAARRSAEGGGRRDMSKPALVKRELEQLLEYKRRELRELELGEGRAKAGAGLRAVSDEIAAVREQVDGLQAHLRAREDALADLKRQIDDEKRSR